MWLLSSDDALIYSGRSELEVRKKAVRNLMTVRVNVIKIRAYVRMFEYHLRLQSIRDEGVFQPLPADMQWIEDALVSQQSAVPCGWTEDPWRFAIGFRCRHIAAEQEYLQLLLLPPSHSY